MNGDDNQGYKKRNHTGTTPFKDNRYRKIVVNIVALGAIFGGVWLIIGALDFVGLFRELSQSEKLFVLILTAMASIVILSWYNYFLLKKDKEKSTVELENIRKELTVQKPKDRELLQIGYNRNRINFVEMIASAKKKIDLLGLSLAPFTTEACISQMFDSITKKDIRIRVLLLNPFSINTFKRDPELYKGILPLPLNIVESIIIFNRLKQRLEDEGKTHSKNLEVKVHSDIPTVSCFFVDNILNISSYLTYRTGVKSPYLEIHWIEKVDECLYDVYLQNYELIFAKSISIFKNGFIDEMIKVNKQESELLTDKKITKIIQMLGEEV